MPIPLALVAAGGQVLGNAINSFSQGANNRASRRFSQKMYEWQLQDARADRDYENMYNSPVEQMKRLKAAGLNPNLVYGNGSATEQSAHSRGADYQDSQLPTPQWGNAINAGAQGFVGHYYDVGINEARITNLQLQAAQRAQDLANNTQRMARVAAGTALTEQQKKMLEIQTEIANATKTTSIEFAQAKLNEMQGRGAVAWDNHEFLQHTMKYREQLIRGQYEKVFKELAYIEAGTLLRGQQLETEKERTLEVGARARNTQWIRDRIDAQIALMKKDGTLKDMEIELRAAYGDMERISQIFQKFMPSFRLPIGSGGKVRTTPNPNSPWNSPEWRQFRRENSSR